MGKKKRKLRRRDIQKKKAVKTKNNTKKAFLLALPLVAAIGGVVYLNLRDKHAEEKEKTELVQQERHRRVFRGTHIHKNITFLEQDDMLVVKRMDEDGTSVSKARISEIVDIENTTIYILAAARSSAEAIKMASGAGVGGAITFYAEDTAKPGVYHPIIMIPRKNLNARLSSIGVPFDLPNLSAEKMTADLMDIIKETMNAGSREQKTGLAKRLAGLNIFRDDIPENEDFSKLVLEDLTLFALHEKMVRKYGIERYGEKLRFEAVLVHELGHVVHNTFKKREESDALVDPCWIGKERIAQLAAMAYYDDPMIGYMSLLEMRNTDTKEDSEYFKKLRKSNAWKEILAPDRDMYGWKDLTEALGTDDCLEHAETDGKKLKEAAKKALDKVSRDRCGITFEKMGDVSIYEKLLKVLREE